MTGIRIREKRLVVALRQLFLFMASSGETTDRRRPVATVRGVFMAASL